MKHSNLFATCFERKEICYQYEKICGIDEAGRGPLAGPLVVAACLFPSSLFHLDTKDRSLPQFFYQIADSKALSPKKRRAIFKELIVEPRLEWSFTIISPAIIDRLNIRNATLKGMVSTVIPLGVESHYLLSDGRDFPFPNAFNGQSVIRGDQCCLTVAAASIIAKEVRDQYMGQLDLQFPQYSFIKNKGYGTKDHLQALVDHGASPIHRQSFRPISMMIAQQTGIKQNE